MRFFEGKFRGVKIKLKNHLNKGRNRAKKMNNPNPFVPQGSLLEQQSRRRSRLKLGVFCVLAISVTGLVAMLIQGCKREQPVDNALTPDTNSIAMTDTNPPPIDTNTSAMVPPPVTNPPIVVPPPVVAPVETAGTEYVVVAGDTLAKIAKSHGVSLKALEAANPGVDPKKLKVKQKLTIPGATSSATETSAASNSADTTGGETYAVKSGDSLTKIAKSHGVSVKALKAANNLTTDHIKVGQKLKIPGKAESAAPASAATDSVPAMTSPTATTAPSPTPAK